MKIRAMALTLTLVACSAGPPTTSLTGALDSALVAAYGCDEGAGAVLHDSSGHGLDGSLAGQTWNASGKYGGSLTFTGSNFVTVADNPLLRLTTGMTLSAWVFPTDDGSWHTIAAKERPSNLAYALYQHNGAKPLGRVANGNTNFDDVAGAKPALNAWTYLAVTFDGATERVYVNGALASPTKTVGKPITATTQPLRIGGHAAFGVPGDLFMGRIDELRLYSRALSQAEIAADMAAPVSAGSGGAGGGAGSGGAPGGAGGGAGAGGAGGSAGTTGGGGGSAGTGGAAGAAGAGGGAGAVDAGADADQDAAQEAGGSGGSAGAAGAGGAGGGAGSSCAAPVEPFYADDQPSVQVMTPMACATLFAPATVRVWVHAPDGISSGYAPSVDFFADGAVVGTRSAVPGHADYYQLDVPGLAAGAHEVWARSHLAAGGTVDSVHVPLTVVDLPATTGPIVNLTGDLVLSGSANFDLVGAPGARARLTSSNGSRVRSVAGWTGHFVMRDADVVGLGSLDVASVEVSVAGSAALEVSGSVFDRSGPPSFTVGDQVPVTIVGNVFQPNTLVTESDVQDYADSKPCVQFTGGVTTTAKTFQGNDVGVGYVQFSNTAHWLVGGDHDADGNVVIGVRGGFKMANTSAMTLRGNFSYHRYPYGWSEGHNINFEGSAAGELIEHNVIRSGSWMVQGVVGEVRYNLMLDNNEAFVRSNAAGTPVHHNVMADVALRRAYYPSGGMTLSAGSFYNNTVDVGGQAVGWHYDGFVRGVGSTITSGRNNVFTGFAFFTAAPVFESGSAASADYNAWWNPDSEVFARYAGSGFGAHDVAGGASTNPQFAGARAVPFPYAVGDVWRRAVTVSQLLSAYRARYQPLPGSPLVDVGDPADDVGGVRCTDVGAVGAGNPHPLDKFGTFGP